MASKSDPTTMLHDSKAPKTRLEVASLLAQDIPLDLIAKRKGPGNQDLYYAPAGKIIDMANDIFGFDGWASSVIDVTLDYIDEAGNGRINVGVSAIVRVTLKCGNFHEDIGYGQGAGNNKGETLEKAKKESVTDALKRALRHFGRHLGGSIYDQRFLEDAKKHNDNPGLANSMPLPIPHRPALTAISSPPQASRTPYSAMTATSPSAFQGNVPTRLAAFSPNPTSSIPTNTTTISTTVNASTTTSTSSSSSASSTSASSTTSLYGKSRPVPVASAPIPVAEQNTEVSEGAEDSAPSAKKPRIDPVSTTPGPTSELSRSVAITTGLYGRPKPTPVTNPPTDNIPNNTSIPESSVISKQSELRTPPDLETTTQAEHVIDDPTTPLPDASLIPSGNVAAPTDVNRVKSEFGSNNLYRKSK